MRLQEKFSLVEVYFKFLESLLQIFFEIIVSGIK